MVSLAFGSVGLAIGLRSGSPESVQSIFPLIFVFLFMSSMSIPRNLMDTDWFRTVATYNPVSYMVEGLRSLLVTGWDPEALALGFACAIVVLVIGLAISSSSLEGEDGEDVIRRYFSVAGGMAWRLLRTLGGNPALFLPPMLMPIFFFVAFAGGLSAISNARIRLSTRLHGVRLRVRASSRRRPSVASSPASRSPRISSSASGGDCCWRRRIAAP